MIPKKFRQFSIWLAVVPAGVLCGQPPEYSGFQLNWADEFSDDALDLERWTPAFSITPTNNSLHAYLPQNVIVANGNLIIVSTDQPFGQLPYRSGQVISNSTMRFGRVEVRGNLPTTNGMWPAIWLLPDQPPYWPSQGEIDIMENRGNEQFLTSSAFHWGTNPPFSHFFVFAENETTINGQPVNYHDSMHVYAAEWDPQQIRFYVDGVHYFTVRDSQVGQFLSSGQTEPMRLIINTAIGGDFLPNPDPSTQWPQFFEVDYVYVYDRVGDPTLALENGGFDAMGGSLSNWSLFGSNGMNVSSSQAQSLSGTSSLKVFGQFNGSQNFSGVEQGVSVQPGDQIQVRANSFVPSNDALAGSGNQAFLKFDFYNTQFGAFGSSQYIGSQQILIADSSTLTDNWHHHQLSATCPAGSVEARVAIVFRQVNNAAGSVFVDGVEFTNLTSTISVHPSSLSIESGIISSGGISETISTDDEYLRVIAGTPSATGPFPVQLVLVGNSPFTTPSSIEFIDESASNTVGLTARIEAFDFVAGGYEIVSERETLMEDHVQTALLPANAARFVENGTGQMRIRVSWRPAATTLFFPWHVRIDEWRWTVHR